MKTRYLKVTDTEIKPIPERMQDQATHTVSVKNDDYPLSGSGNDWKLVDGKPVLLTQEERDAKKAESIKQNAIQEAETLYKELKCDRIITHNGIKYDLKDSFEFDFQRKKGGEVWVKVKDGKTKVMTKQDTDDLETALFTYLNDLATDFDADMDLIEAGDYTLPNLKARI